MRDDVERALATRLGAMPAAYTKAMSISQQLQAAITSEPTVAVAALKVFIAQSSCATSSEQAAVIAAEEETLDNRERQKAMVDAYTNLIEAQLAANDLSPLSPTTCL